MSKPLTQIDYDHINMILEESAKYGVKREVCESVSELLKTNPDIDIIEAYNSAFKWCLPGSSIESTT